MKPEEAIEELRKLRPRGGIIPQKRAEMIDFAISALKEIQLYKDNKLCLIPEDVYSKQCEELDAYKEIGTVEECREAVEKQKPKKPHRNYKKFSGLWCKCGWYLGQKQCLDIKYCPNCGQAIDENLEGMEDGVCIIVEGTESGKYWDKEEWDADQNE